MSAKITLIMFQILFFLFPMAILGLAYYILNTFMFIYLQEEKGMPLSLSGVLAAIAVLSEIPLFFFSKGMMTKLTHHQTIVCFLVLNVFLTKIPDVVSPDLSPSILFNFDSSLLNGPTPSSFYI